MSKILVEAATGRKYQLQKVVRANGRFLSATTGVSYDLVKVYA